MKKRIYFILPVLLFFIYLLIQSSLFFGFETIRMLRGKAKFNPEKWDIATNTRLDGTYIIDSKNSRTISLDSNNSEYFRKILKSFRPISSAASTEVNTNLVKFILGFQSGKDVTEIPVVIDGNELYAWIGDGWWGCGKSTSFTNLIYGLNEFQRTP